MEIKLIQNTEIDQDKYDRSIAGSFNASIFALTWFLNICSPGWDLLMLNDYEYCMPLTFRKVAGIKFLRNGPFCMQAGIFSKKEIPKKMIQSFISAIPANYIPHHYAFNIFNQLNTRTTDHVYSLDLIQDYSQIQLRYSHEYLKLLNKAKDQKLHFSESLNNHTFLQFYAQCKKGVLSRSVIEQKIKVLRKIISTGMRFRFLSIYGVYNQTNSLCAATIILKSFGRLILLAPCFFKDEVYFSFLLDSLILTFSGNAFILDYYPEEKEPVTKEFFLSLNLAKNQIPVLKIGDKLKIF